MKRSPFLFPLLVIAAGLAAYSNSFSVPFLFDDPFFIVQNPSIRRLWPPWGFLVSPSHFEPFAHRPILFFSFAVNYAVGRLNVWGYHAVNLAIHLLAGLVLFGIVRRTLAGERLRARYGSASEGLALAVALLWVTHPLHTECVTYIYQRAESLLGLFYLSTLYAVLRAAQSSHPRRWNTAAVVACALGMLGKQTFVTAPVAVFLYDRVFLAGSSQEALHRRGRLYAALAATWGIPAILLATAHNEIPSNSGFMFKGFTPIRYALTQPQVILHYLKLAFWPHPLVIHYDWPMAHGVGQILPPSLAIGGLLLATLWALHHKPELGFLGGWFFLILAPTSSFIPMALPALEHRMYLPLASLVTLVVLGADELLRDKRLAAGLAAAAIAALGTVTVLRNKDYQDEVTLWRVTVADRPSSPKARYNLGVIFIKEQRWQEAAAQLRQVLEITPDDPEAHNNLGVALGMLGQYEEAALQFQEALRLKPDDGEPRRNLQTLLEKKRTFHAR